MGKEVQLVLLDGLLLSLRVDKGRDAGSSGADKNAAATERQCKVAVGQPMQCVRACV